MTLSHAHLYLNHLPVVGLPFSIILFFIAWKKKNEGWEKIATGFLIASALLVIPVYLTGEPAEEAYNFPSGTESFIESHEGMAKVALISSIALVLTGLLGILIQKAQVALFLKRSAGLLGLVTSVVLLLTASRGGPIRHTEIRDSVQSAPAETRDEPAEQEDSPDEGDEI